MLNDIMSRCDYLDLMELLADRRAACRVSVRDGRLPQLLDIIQELKLEFGVMPSPHFVTNIYGAVVDRHRHDDEYEVYLSKDVFTVRDVMAAEGDHDYKYIGKLYGYPECCVFHFVESWIGEEEQHKQYPHLSYALFSASRGQHFKKIMTPDLDNRVLSLFPCEFDCEQAIEKATWRADFMKHHHNWIPQPTVFCGVAFDAA